MQPRNTNPIMRRHLILVFILCLSLGAAGVERVTLAQLQADWQKYNNQIVEITTPMVVCGNFYDSLILAPERLVCPEEKAVGLAEGDSTDYWQIAQRNLASSVCLHCRNNYYEVRTGDVARNVRARVTGERQLLTGQSIRTHHQPAQRLPGHKKDELRIVGANIENYFADLGGYASKKTTPQQLAMKTRKLTKALRAMDADIVAMCEMQKGNHAPEMLLAALNRSGKRYAYVETGWPNQDRIGGCFFYRADRVRPYGEWMSAYRDTTSYYHSRMITQAFEQLDAKGQPTGQRFIVSVNHFKSKGQRRHKYDTNAKRLENTDSLLVMLPEAIERFDDPDVLLLGDYNCYSQEQPIQRLVRAGYPDMLQVFCPDDYSYSYRGQIGYLDRCFASPSMVPQVIRVLPWHVNADWYGSHAAYKLRDKSYHRYADHDPIIVDIKLR